MISLDTSVEQLPKIGLSYQKKLKKLGIKTVQDLLFYFPARYDDFSDIIPINKVQAGQIACVQGKIISVDQTLRHGSGQTKIGPAYQKKLTYVVSLAMMKI